MTKIKFRGTGIKFKNKFNGDMVLKLDNSKVYDITIDLYKKNGQKAGKLDILKLKTKWIIPKIKLGKID